MSIKYAAVSYGYLMSTKSAGKCRLLKNNCNTVRVTWPAHFHTQLAGMVTLLRRSYPIDLGRTRRRGQLRMTSVAAPYIQCIFAFYRLAYMSKNFLLELMPTFRVYLEAEFLNVTNVHIKHFATF